MFYACVERFDGMDEKFLGEELNRALLLFDSSRHSPSIFKTIGASQLLITPLVGEIF